MALPACAGLFCKSFLTCGVEQMRSICKANGGSFGAWYPPVGGTARQTEPSPIARPSQITRRCPGLLRW